MNAYTGLERQLARVRRAWKRTAALAGLAIACVEAIGLFSLLLVLNWFYQPGPAARVAISTAGLVVLLLLIWRHIVKPLARRIPDEQAALFMEERDRHYQGALLTAVEFGGQSGLSPVQARMIDLTVAEATRQAAATDPRRVVPLLRLRKYGLAALVLVAVYAAAFALFSERLIAPARQVVAPWRPTARDLPTGPAGPMAPVDLGPIQVTISATTPALRPDGAIHVPRGGALELDVTLSRPSDQPVNLLYRPAGSNLPYQRLPMAASDKLHGFAARLSDISEDIEVAAATGAHESGRHKVTVYDPIVLAGVEVGIKYPDYLQLADFTQVQATGDVTAPVGAQVTLRFQTNRPVQAGQLAFADGAPVALSADPANPTTAVARFPVTADRGYSFTLTDIDGQEYRSPAPSLVHAVPDAPPSIAVKYPLGPLALHPMGEVNFLIDASDDFGIAGVDLLYQPLTDPQAKEVRVPLALPKFDSAGPLNGAALPLSLRFALDELAARLAPGTTISYYLEVRDRKQQKALSDFGFLSVRNYDAWVAYVAPEPPEDETPEPEGIPLDELLKQVWTLHRQKDTLAPADFNQQAEQWAVKMQKEGSDELRALVKIPHGVHKTPARLEHVKKGNEFCAQAHAALKQHDTGAACTFLRFAMAEQTLIMLEDTVAAMLPDANMPLPNTPNGDPKTTFEAMKAKAQALANLEPDKDPKGPNQEKTIKEAQANAAALKQGQEQVLAKAQQQADKPPPDAGAQAQAAPDPHGDPNGGDPKPADAKPADPKPADAKPADPKAPDLAADQTKLAAKAMAAADQLRHDTNDAQLHDVADQFAAAARQMTQAAAQFRQNQTDKATKAATEAHTTLTEAEKKLNALDLGTLDNTVAALEARAGKLARRQREVRAATEDVAKTLPEGKAPDAKQERDLKAALSKEIQLKVEVDKFAADFADLDQHAAGAAKRDTAKHIADAARDLKRGRADQKVANAVVELTANRPAGAAPEQESAEKTLDKVAAGLSAASDSLASDWRSEAQRAKKEAEAADKGLAKLDNQPQPGAKPEPAPTPEERRDTADDAAAQMARLAKHAAARDLGDKPDVERLGQAATNVGQLAKDLQDQAKRAELRELVKRLHNKIEAELEARLSAEKLFAAQREEFPARYRELVGKYYESLSQLQK